MSNSKYKRYNRKSFDINSKTDILYNSSKDLARIAAAATRTEVSAIKIMLKSEMRNIKNSKASQEEIQEVLRKMKKVIKLADKKIRNLKIEEELAKQKELARNIENENMEEKVEKELKNRKKTRKMKEITDIVSTDDIIPIKKSDSFDMKINTNNLDLIKETIIVTNICEQNTNSEIDLKL